MTEPMTAGPAPGIRRYRLTAPLRYAPWNLPAVQISPAESGGWLCCGLTWPGPTHSTWRIVVTGYSDHGVVVLYDQPQAIRRPVERTGWGRQAREVLASACAFLLADADAYRRTMGGGTPDDGWCFTEQVAAWAYLNDGELASLAADLAGAP
ncbi:hypothetical protein AB0M47_05110 [Hamadaea sp. NPDC051192]|uniref:hypothetical protein n=1 Tax=Hamadaea sp. NPDC051192 TaxID=3154940 RepID=UPI00342D0B97